MHPAIRNLLAHQSATGYADFAGATVTVRLPVRDSVVWELIQPLIAGHRYVEDLEIRTRVHNRLEMQVTTSGIPLARRIALAFVVHPHLVFAPAPSVRLDLQRAGAASYVVGLLRPLLASVMPPEARWEGDALWIDLDIALRRHGLGDIVPLIESGQFTSEEGCLWIDLTVRR